MRAFGWIACALALIAVSMFYGCATTEQKFQTYYGRCESYCKAGKKAIQVEVSTLEMVYKCECGASNE